MNIYIPVTVFRAGEVLHGMEALEADRCFMIAGNIHCMGRAYGNTAYTDPEGVRLYWSKETWRAEKYRYNVKEVRR